jgi:hypothetical protein
MKLTSFESAKFINSEEELEDEIKADIVIFYSRKKKSLKMLQKD